MRLWWGSWLWYASSLLAGESLTIGVLQQHFSKYLIPSDIFSCDKPLLVEPGDDPMSPGNAFMMKLGGERAALKPTMHKRNVFTTCALTSIVNEASLFFKLHHCKQDVNRVRSILLLD